MSEITQVKLDELLHDLGHAEWGSPKEAEQVLQEILDKWYPRLSAQALAEFNALRPQPLGESAVKALEWKELGGPSRFWPKIWYGSGIFRANYKVEQSHPDETWYSVGTNFSTLAEAQAAAQTHYAQCITATGAPNHDH